MKIKYKFANGEISYVEVSDEVGQAILDSRRKEASLDKKEYRHSACSIDAVEFEGEEFADKHTPESLLFNKEEDKRVKEFLATLTETQRRRLEMRMNGMNLRQICLAEKADNKTIRESFEQIQKKFQTFFKNTPLIYPQKCLYSEGAL